jgi:hypothetical protein
MDDEQSQTATSGSLSIVRAAGVIILFVVAVAILVSVGTRPSVSSTPTTTTPTTAAAGGATTTTVAGGATAPTTTTTAAHTTTTKAGHKGTTTTTAPPSATTVVVANGTSVNGLAAHYSTVIGAGGWTMKTPIDAATSVATSAVYYAAGQQQQAASIANTIGVKPAEVLPITTATPVTGATGVDVVVVIGADLSSTTTATT